MANQTAGISVVDIPVESGEEAAEVLALAFDHDPLTRYFLRMPRPMLFIKSGSAR